jgi:prophage maintenance system killer protein
VHNAEPSVSLKVPAMHEAQLAAFEPVKPRLHRHMVESLLPATETAFVVQETHVAFDVAAMAVENLLIEIGRAHV